MNMNAEDWGALLFVKYLTFLVKSFDKTFANQPIND